MPIFIFIANKCLSELNNQIIWIKAAVDLKVVAASERVLIGFSSPGAVVIPNSPCVVSHSFLFVCDENLLAVYSNHIFKQGDQQFQASQYKGIAKEAKLSDPKSGQQ